MEKCAEMPLCADATASDDKGSCRHARVIPDGSRMPALDDGSDDGRGSRGIRGSELSHEGVVMIRIHRIAAGLVAVVAGIIGLCAVSPAAFAATANFPAGDGYGGSPPTPVQTVVMGGMAGWQVALIAVATALVAAAAAVAVDRAWSARRRLAPAA
jgi:hypothetical protein